MISERTLKRWRGEALKDVHTPDWNEANAIYIKERGERILKLTQELMDSHLMKKL